MTHVHTYKHSPDGFISLLVSGLRSLNPTDGSHAALLTNNLFTFHMLTARIIRCITHRDTGTRLRQFIRFSYCWNNWNKTFFTFRFVWNYTLHLQLQLCTAFLLVLSSQLVVTNTHTHRRTSPSLVIITLTKDLM